MRRQQIKSQFTAVGLACTTLLGGCGGGGGSGGDAGLAQSISFPFPGGQMVAVPPEVATITLNATASSGGPVTYASNTPATCTVSGATVSLLKAGECSLNANQAGGNGYAPASTRQLFVIPKRPQKVLFRNPGGQALDGAPVTLAATSDLGLPVTFTSSTPAVCTVSGTALQKLANGLCAITATQQGSDIYEKASVIRNIPIGTEQAPALTFLSGYKDTNRTREEGAIGSFAGSELDNWWCGGDWCGRVAAADGNSFTFFYDLQPKAPGKIGSYMGFNVLAPGLSDLVKDGDTPAGVRIDAQAALKFSLAQNAEWISAGNNTVSIELFLGHYAKKGNDACNVRLRATVTPSSAAATGYSVGLKDKFTISETCGLAGLDAWNELQDYPVAKIEFTAADGANSTVATASATKLTYSSKLTVNGPITFQ
jgi:hypothetical protein